MPANRDYVYTIHLRVDVKGPDTDWDTVAQHLARRVEGLSLVRGGGFHILRAEVDAAATGGDDDA